jgi:hypothetical protein
MKNLALIGFLATLAAVSFLLACGVTDSCVIFSCGNSNACLEVWNVSFCNGGVGSGAIIYDSYVRCVR